MAFDAGTIVAHLDLDDQDFDRKLREDVARIEAFEKRQHEISLKTDVDRSSASRAEQEMSRLDRKMTEDAHRRGGMMSFLMGGRRGSGAGYQLSRLLSTSPSGGDQSHLARIASAAGPGFGPLSARGALLSTAGVLGGAALPALAGVGAVAGVGALGAGVIGLGAKTLIGTKKDPGALYQPAQQLMDSMKDTFAKAAQPMLEPLRKAFAEIPKLLHGLLPELKQLFAGASTLIQPLLHGLVDIAHDVLPGLAAAFRAVAPSIRPLLDGVGSLVKGILPGLVSLLKAAHPAIVVFSQILGRLGRDLGQMFRILGPAMQASARVLKAVFDVVGGLLPIIAKLADVFARALAPVIGGFAQAIKALEPALIIVGRVLGELAKAVLGDLVAAFLAIARLIKDISPALTILGKALGQVFSALESAGLFGALASALEQIAPLLAKFINLLVRQMAPMLPVIVTLISQFGTILIQLLAAGLSTVLVFLTSLLKHLPWLVPVITAVMVVWGAWNLLMAASPMGLIIIAIVAVIGAITLLATHWHRVWTDIKNWAEDAWHFLTHGWGQFLFPQLYLIRKVVEFVRDHWRQAWNDMKGAAQAVWHFLDNNIIHPIAHVFTVTLPNAFSYGYHWFFDHFCSPIKNAGLATWHFLRDNVFGPLANVVTKTIPNAFTTGAKGIGKAWSVISGVVKAPVKWVIDNVVNGLIHAFDWVSDKVHGPHISDVHPFGLQTGGRIPGYGGGDRHMALLEGGEAVVSKETTAAHAADLRAWGVPGFQSGGRVGQHPIGRAQAQTGLDPSKFHGTTAPNVLGSIWHKAADIAKATLAIATMNSKALTNAISDMFPHGVGGAGADLATLLTRAPVELLGDAVHFLISQFGGGGGLNGRGADIARFAMSFAGKIPYVWGGTAVPGGADCSGFVQSIYRHFNITAPRTSEAQGSWVKRGAPVTGGLAFYNSPAGGPPPGHVAIVGFHGNVISQGGGLGPQIQPLRSMPFMFAGVPPGGGLGSVGPGDLRGLEALWMRAGGGGGNTAHVAGAIGMAESGGQSVKQQGQPPGLTGWGIWQITPTSGIWQNGRFGNLMNSFNNARAAVYLWSQAGRSFTPWATYNSGAYQRFMDQGGWLDPGASLVLNQTRRGEAVLTPGQSRAFVALSEAAEEFARGRGTPGPHGLMRDVHLTLPEGATVAEALREIGWLLRTSSQLGFTGVR